MPLALVALASALDRKRFDVRIIVSFRQGCVI